MAPLAPIIGRHVDGHRPVANEIFGGERVRDGEEDGGEEGGVVRSHAHKLGRRVIVVVESIFPGDMFADGIGINKLTSPDPAPPNGGAVFHDTAVWLKPLA